MEILKPETLKAMEESLVPFRYMALVDDLSEERESAPFHYELSNLMLNETDHVLVEMFRESGKALALDTVIPTPDGTKTMGEIKRGDKVFDMLGDVCNVKAVTDIQYGHKCYEVMFSTGEKVVADADHEWIVNDKTKRKNPRVYNTEFLFKTYTGYNHKNGYSERRYNIPVCEPVKYKEKELAIDPYVLGFWLGDGTSSGTSFTVGHQDSKDVVELFRQKGYFLDKLKAEFSYSITKHRHNFTKYNLIHNKHIPSDYLYSSLHQRLSLLQGLIDSDGTIAKKGSKRGTVTFTNKNTELIRNLQQLLGSLGIKATKTTKIIKDIGVYYNVSFKTELCVSGLLRKSNASFEVFPRSKKRVITKITPVESVPVKCIAVDGYKNSYLITNSFITTHNSSFALRAYPLHALAYPTRNRDYIVLLKNNTTMAKAKLLEIRDEYKNNPILSHNLVEIKEDSSQIFSVDVRDRNDEIINIRLEAYGKGASIRGLVNRDRRPKIIVADDIQDKEDATSETVSATDWDWFLSDLLFLGKRCRIFYIANNLGERCIAERIANNVDKLQGIKFKVIKIPVMVDNKPTWPDGQTIEQILAERDDFAKLGKLDIWYAEKMCMSLAEESRIFKEEDYKYYENMQRDRLMKDCKLYACLDPASSTKSSSCYRAISVIGVDSRNFWYVFDNKYGRWDTNEMIDQIFRTVEEYNLYEFHIEKGQIQQVLEPIIMKEQRDRNLFFTCKGLEHAKEGNKLDRIKALQPRFKSKQILFPNGNVPWLPELKSELAGVTREDIKSEYIDCVDALAMQIQVAKAPRARSRGVTAKKFNGRFH